MLTQAGTLVKYKIGPPLKPSRAAENLATTKLPKMVNCIFEDIFEPQPNSITGWDSYSATYVKEKPDIICPGFAQKQLQQYIQHNCSNILI